jgi:hypothetical protein
MGLIILVACATTIAAVALRTVIVAGELISINSHDEWLLHCGLRH